MNIQDINSNAQTVNLSDLFFASAIDSELVTTCDSEIEDGDLISYTDDEGCKCYATYVTLWAYEHNGETSPYVTDKRVMAYVLPIEGGSDFADIETIKKLVDAFPTMKA